MTQKKETGQFYTITNPFDNWYFKVWFNSIKDEVVLEPFAGFGG